MKDNSMTTATEVSDFLAHYDDSVFENAFKIREMLFKNLPGIIEQIDLPAKMIAYCYGQKYIEMICMLIPSKKGLKLSFYNGIALPDPEHLLEGKAKTTRYVEIKSRAEINSNGLKGLIKNALAAYKERINSQS